MKEANKKKFVVRKNCEYSTVVEARTADEAVELAENSTTSWEQAWSRTEAEEE